jgi:hypothetical protein
VQQLISGGVDGFISFASQGLQHFERTAPLLETALSGRLMLMKYVNYLEAWKQAAKDFSVCLTC